MEFMGCCRMCVLQVVIYNCIVLWRFCVQLFVFEFSVLSCFQTSVYQAGQVENSTNDALPFELQGQAESDLLRLIKLQYMGEISSINV